MENREGRNLNLTGNGTVGGGLYNKVKIVGDETIQGDLDCLDFLLVGNCQFGGNVKTKTGKLTGTADIKGGLEADELTIVGTVRIDEAMAIKNLKLYGETRARGNASLEKAEIFGCLDIQGDCNTESFKTKGPFQIGGLLNAGQIEIQLHSTCRTKEIGGGSIDIRRGTDMVLKKFIKSFYMPRDFYQGQLLTDTIEGDDIYLEYTKAKVIRGNNIDLGPGCEIELVEYRSTFKKQVDCKVENTKKL